MHGAAEIIEQATSLPVEDRIRIVDSLLRTLNAASPEAERAWAEVARQRLEDLRSGRVEAISGEAVLGKIRDRFKR